MQLKLELLTPEEVAKIHEYSLMVLEQVGVVFKKAEAIELFRRHGAKVDGETAYLKRDMVEQALAAIPKTIPLYGRDPGKSVTVGAGKVVCAPGSGAVFVLNNEQGRRKGLSEDYVNFVRLAHTSPMIQVNGGTLVTPSDVEDKIMYAFMMAAIVKNTDKPLLGFTLGAEHARECLSLAQLAFGEKKENIILGVANAVTPLLYDKPMVEGIMEFVQHDQPICIASCGMAGSTAPATLAGSIACVNAELLAGLVLTQLIKPGAPVIYGNTSAITDMKTMGLAIGAVETGMMNLATAQLAKYYGVPYRTGGSLSDSKEVDVQAGYEAMLSMATTVFHGASFVLQAMGILESFMTLSYEKFIIDEEIGLMLKRYAQGFGLEKEDLAFELIKTKGPGSHFIDTEHTLANFRSQFFNPLVANRQPYDVWQRQPLPAVKKAGQIWKERLAQFEAPKLAPECEKAVNQFLINKYGSLPQWVK